MRRRAQGEAADSEPRDSSSPASGGPDGTVEGFRCDLCGGAMLNRHCKLLCLQCGYQRDCSDP